MAFEIKETSLTGIHSFVDRLHPFDEIAQESKNDQHHKQQKKLVRGYFVKAVVLILVFSLLTVNCYLLNKVNYLNTTDDAAMVLNLKKNITKVQLLVEGK